MPLDLDKVQGVLQSAGVDGWLMCDFRRSNAVAHRVLGLSPQAVFSRRWGYYVPAHGEPSALVSAVEPHVLASLGGRRIIYRTWQEYQEALGQILDGARRVAMEYVPNDAIPYVSLVDAGTVELVRAFGVEVVSSADFVQIFEAVLSPAQIDSHRQAGRALLAARDAVLEWLRERIQSGSEIDEYALQQRFAALMRERGLEVPPRDRPIVAVNGNAANPHYTPGPDHSSPVRPGDLLLLDFSARFPDPTTVFADYTWMVYIGERVPERIGQLFAIIREARDTGIALLRQRFESRELVRGYEVDDAVRAVITEAGYAHGVLHRTGHNIGTLLVHGNGAHLDNLETHDTRPLLINTCTSVEPGIYLPQENIGVRTEVDVLLLPDGIEVTGVPAQEQVLALLA